MAAPNEKAPGFYRAPISAKVKEAPASNWLSAGRRELELAWGGSLFGGSAALQKIGREFLKSC
jgi:hypothetical protein